MKKSTGWLLGILILGGIAIGFYFWQQYNATPPAAPPPPVVIEAPPPVAPPLATHYPIPEIPPEQVALPLPSLQDSDAAFSTVLSDLFGAASMTQLLNPNSMIRHIVVTIDNLPRKVLAQRLLPTKRAPGKFLTAGQGEQLTIAPDNSARYVPYAQLAENIDTAKLLAVYRYFYPLFQRAYQDLGYPNGYFNDRLVVVIDHLLATPSVDAPIALTQPHILYQFADPALEASSSGQKILLRIGPSNAEKIKAKLREIRSGLGTGVPAPAKP